MFSKALLNKYYRYAYSLTGDKDNAYDLLHDVIEKIIRNSNSKEISDSYMYNAIRNRAIDLWRKDKRRPTESLDEPSNIVELADPSFEDVVADKNEVNALMAAISEEERSLLFLHVVEGYTIQEIADQLETPKGTILSKIHRVKGKITKLLPGEEKKRRGV